eukprot:CAMPEP_0113311878 /NCGR_PEP_ID=MMETSP0010_2-20120614/8927_1 /TAXON_ID=216773 ORGANISM="Corethron hystrix, Strain 308" /NCGR_SAMPLE_ID=MMETSP0010_2 /ASSEMBLY_ACC=CAM_ASM_000155 /LENGTH=534 /DNA_ID=CAMNT_0000167581 /DNA_START=454 /DNA_END=2059 /DNA_ORIENTATION=- /assembly_acc=CAM_ASM_000155
MAKVADLSGAGDVEDVVDALARKLSELGGDSADPPLLKGAQWDQEEIGRTPTRRDLDRVSESVPIVCFRRCWHIVACNSAAIVRCGIDNFTADGYVKEGVDLDADARPTGVLRENAVGLLEPLLSMEDKWEEKVELLGSVLKSLPSRGVVSVQSIDTHKTGAISDAWDVYVHLLQCDSCGPENELPVRIIWTSDFERVHEDIRESPRTDFLHHERTKIFMDGGLGASTAALLDDYSDGGPGDKGMITMSDEQLDEAFVKAKSANLRIEAHAIGDAACDKILKKFERCRFPDEYVGGPVITHVQILNEDLLARMANFHTENHGKNNILFSNIQPQFTASDLPIILPKLGHERAKTSYVWSSIQNIGRSVICGGSDSPVEDLCPLKGMAAAMRNVLHPDQNLNLADALAAYTKNAAECGRFRDKAARQTDAEKHSGCLARGSLADFVVLQSRPSTERRDGAPMEQLEKVLLTDSVQIFWTYIGGKQTYDSEINPKCIVTDCATTTKIDPFMPVAQDDPSGCAPAASNAKFNFEAII